MSDEVKKIAGYMAVSDELLRSAREMVPVLLRMFGPDDRTPERKAADEKRWREMDADRKRAERALLDEHAQRMATATGLRRAILELHAPQQYQQLGGVHCDGCDMEGYEAEAPDFPCRTYTLAAEATE